MKVVYCVMSNPGYEPHALVSIWQHYVDAMMEANRLNNESCYTLYYVRGEEVK